MVPLRNADWLLALGRMPVVRQALTKVGIVLPFDLERGSAQGKWFEQPLLRHCPVDVLVPGKASGSTIFSRDGFATRGGTSPAALIVDATPGLSDPRELFGLLRDSQAKNYLRTTIVFTAGSTDESRAAAAGIGGLIRSLAKEIGGRGRGINGVCVHGPSDIVWPRATAHAAGYLSLPESSFITGQVVHAGRNLEGAEMCEPVHRASLTGSVALVTGAARGIGAAVATRLAREGATVVGVDVPSVAEQLRATMSALGGIPVLLDITSPNAANRLVAELRAAHITHTHIVVHNAGVTRDKTLRRMKDEAIDAVLSVNLEAPMALTDALLKAGLLGWPADSKGGLVDKVICLSSISGIGGAFGQTNYAYSKAGLIG